MNCSDAQYLMPLYLSGELDASSMAQLERHVTECPACRHQMEEQQDLDRSLRNALLSEPVDATMLRANVLAQIRRLQPVHTNNDDPKTVRRVLAFAAAVLIMIAAGAVYRDNARYEQASIDHVDEVVQAHPKEWRTQGNGIQQLVSLRIPTSPKLHQLAVPGYQLLRGKECSIAQNRYIHLVYGNGTQQISMYVLAGNENGLIRRLSTSLLPLVRSHSESGYNVTEGDSRGRRILLVSTMPQEEEQAIVKSVLQTMS